MSSKKRKLCFIRSKNKLRKGYPIFVFEKITEETSQFDEKIILDILDVGYFLKQFNKKYKLNFELVEIAASQIDDDFVKKLITLRLKFKWNGKLHNKSTK